MSFHAFVSQRMYINLVQGEGTVKPFSPFHPERDAETVKKAITAIREYYNCND